MVLDGDWSRTLLRDTHFLTSYVDVSNLRLWVDNQGKLLSLPHRIELTALLDTIGNNLVKLLQVYGTYTFDLNIENPIHLQRRKDKPSSIGYRLVYSKLLATEKQRVVNLSDLNFKGLLYELVVSSDVGILLICTRFLD